jgi:UDP-N-acetylmuramoylalanine--D-glutamate ligase
LEELRDERVDVVGVASVEGGEMARFLLAAGFTKVVGHDLQGSPEELARAHHLAHAGLRPADRASRLQFLEEGLHRLQLGHSYLDGIEESALVVPTQAWFMQSANQRLHQLRAAGKPFYSLVQAYLDLARGPVAGITGSHGKSTTSALVAAALSRAQLFSKVWLAGNDRHSRQDLEEVARDLDGTGCLVLEISNRQLLQMERAPDVACITNITPNHLEEHEGMEGYVACKRRIVELPGCRVGIRNADDPVSMSTGPLPPGVRELRFAQLEGGLERGDGVYEADGAIWLRQEGQRHQFLELARLQLHGDHNHANVRAAIAVCAALSQFTAGAIPQLAEGMERLGTLPHRIQLVWQADGVDYYDDLSSTTPQSTVAAIATVGRPLVLICGGQDKGIGFGSLAELVGRLVRQVLLLPGTGSDRLFEEVAQRGEARVVTRVPSLLEAVRLARETARSGEVILLSPACPGFFTAHYRDGGFRRAVRSLATSPRQGRGPA